MFDINGLKEGVLEMNGNVINVNGKGKREF
jgi:hypothetical protein